MNLVSSLEVLTFARVTNPVVKDEKLFHFTDARGISHWDDEPDFIECRYEMSSEQWHRVEKSYHFYFGFAHTTTGDIHFDSKGHHHQLECYTGLGIMTKQFAMNPPTRGTWIVGITEPGKKGQHFRQWARCTESEKLFAEFVLSGKKNFSSEDRRRLCISRHISQGESSNRLCNMAMLLLARDLNYFLDTRMRHGGGCVDGQVFELCETFDYELWKEYEERARAQNLDPALKYSEYIREPAPRPIIEQRVGGKVENQVPLNTPFAKL